MIIFDNFCTKNTVSNAKTPQNHPLFSVKSPLRIQKYPFESKSHTWVSRTVLLAPHTLKHSHQSVTILIDEYAFNLYWRGNFIVNFRNLLYRCITCFACLIHNAMLSERKLASW